MASKSLPSGCLQAIWGWGEKKGHDARREGLFWKLGQPPLRAPPGLCWLGGGRPCKAERLRLTLRTLGAGGSAEWVRCRPTCVFPLFLLLSRQGRLFLVLAGPRAT